MTRLLPLLLILLLTTTSCDSDDGPSGSEVDGRYRATSITFVQQNGETIPIGTVDVLSFMAKEANGKPVFTIDLFGQDRDYTIAFQLANDNSRSSIRGAFLASRTTAYNSNSVTTRTLLAYFFLRL